MGGHRGKKAKKASKSARPKRFVAVRQPDVDLVKATEALKHESKQRYVLEPLIPPVWGVLHCTPHELCPDLMPTALSYVSNLQGGFRGGDAAGPGETTFAAGCQGFRP